MLERTAMTKRILFVRKFFVKYASDDLKTKNSGKARCRYSTVGTVYFQDWLHTVEYRTVQRYTCQHEDSQNRLGGAARK